MDRPQPRVISGWPGRAQQEMDLQRMPGPGSVDQGIATRRRQPAEMVADQYSLIAVIENCSSIGNSTKVNDCLEAGSATQGLGVLYEDVTALDLQVASGLEGLEYLVHARA